METCTLAESPSALLRQQQNDAVTAAHDTSGAIAYYTAVGVPCATSSTLPTTAADDACVVSAPTSPAVDACDVSVPVAAEVRAKESVAMDVEIALTSAPPQTCSSQPQKSAARELGISAIKQQEEEESAAPDALKEEVVCSMTETPSELAACPPKTTTAEAHDILVAQGGSIHIDKEEPQSQGDTARNDKDTEAAADIEHNIRHADAHANTEQNDKQLKASQKQSVHIAQQSEVTGNAVDAVATLPDVVTSKTRNTTLSPEQDANQSSPTLKEEGDVAAVVAVTASASAPNVIGATEFGNVATAVPRETTAVVETTKARSQQPLDAANDSSESATLMSEDVPCATFEKEAPIQATGDEVQCVTLEAKAPILVAGNGSIFLFPQQSVSLPAATHTQHETGGEWMTGEHQQEGAQQQKQQTTDSLQLLQQEQEQKGNKQQSEERKLHKKHEENDVQEERRMKVRKEIQEEQRKQEQHEPEQSSGVCEGPHTHQQPQEDGIYHLEEEREEAEGKEERDDVVNRMAAVIPRRRGKQAWKAKGQGRSFGCFSLAAANRAKGSWQQQQQQREAQQQMRAAEQQLRGEKKELLRKRRQKREAKKKRKEEANLKGMQVQIIKNTAKIRKWGKKARRDLVKMSPEMIHKLYGVKL